MAQKNTPKNASDARRINVRLSAKQYEELNMLAEHEGRRVTDIIRHVIFMHLNDNEAIAQMRKEEEDGSED